MAYCDPKKTTTAHTNISWIQSSMVYLFLTFLVGLIEKGLVAHPTYKWFFSRVHFLMTFLVGPIDKDLIAHPAGFSPVCLIT